MSSYAVYKEHVEAHLSSVGNSSRWRRGKLLRPEYEAYCEKIGKIPDEFTPEELREMLLERDNVIQKIQWSDLTTAFRAYYNYLIEIGVWHDTNPCSNNMFKQEMFEQYISERKDVVFYYSPEQINKICDSIIDNRAFNEAIIRSIYEGVASSLKELVNIRKTDPAVNEMSWRLKQVYLGLAAEDYYYTSNGRKVAEYIYVDNRLLPTKSKSPDITYVDDEQYAEYALKSASKAIGVTSKALGFTIDLNKVYLSGIVYRFIDKIGGPEEFCNIILKDRHAVRKGNKEDIDKITNILKELGYKSPTKSFIFDVKLFAMQLQNKMSTE